MEPILFPTSMDVSMSHEHMYVSKMVAYSSAYDVALKLRPNMDELRELRPEFSIRWKFFESSPDKSIALLVPCSEYGAPT